MYYWLIGILILISCYFALRYYCLNRGIRSAKSQLREIAQELEQNRIIKCSTPNHQLELLLEEINDNLKTMQKQRIQFNRREQTIRKQIESISHDLRTPLTSMLGYMELMDDTTWTQEEKDYLQIIQRKAKALERLIAAFYDLSRLELNDYYFKMEKMDIHKSLNETMLNFYQDFEDRMIQVDLETGERPSYVFCDGGALERVFMNLIQNTLRYAKSYLKVVLKEEHQNVSIEFENDTDDLKEEDVERLFEPFYIKDESRTSQSTGLGLTITKHIVEQMNGTISAEIRHNPQNSVQLQDNLQSSNSQNQGNSLVVKLEFKISK